MLLCAITSRIIQAGTEAERAERLVALAARWADAGVDFIQIREKDLPAEELLQLSTRIVQVVRASGSTTKVLINGNPVSATAIAQQARADGIHLPGGADPGQLAEAVTQARKEWKTQHERPKNPAISVSCHTVADTLAARAAGVSLALFAPVFEKVLPGAPPIVGQGLASLAEACAAARQPAPQPELPVLALGGVTIQNAADCVSAGAAGIAAVRLFVDFTDPPAWRKLRERATST